MPDGTSNQSDADDSSVELTDGSTDFNFGENDPALQKTRARYRERWHRRGKLIAYNKACEIRDRIRGELGNECKECGARLGDSDSKGKPVALCFDHGENVRDWEPRRMNLLHRMRMYERDHKRGLIHLSCNECNSFDGAWNGKARARRHKKAMAKRHGRQS